jgi:tRNA nucleotidyltransferase/poly(A) polymerase
MQVYLVGGAVRDRFIAKSKGDPKPIPTDLDYAVETDSYVSMLHYVKEVLDFDVKVEKPEFFTIKALNKLGEGCDFTMCRREGPYSDGRHPDWVRSCTIEEDLYRRDCTMNAIAVNVDTGEVIDPTGGVADINNCVIHAVGNAEERCLEDGIRILRYLRFSITKEMELSEDIIECIFNIRDYLESKGTHRPPVSTDRITIEIGKMLAYDTCATLEMFTTHIPSYTLRYLFEEKGIRLFPSTKKR